MTGWPLQRGVGQHPDHALTISLVLIGFETWDKSIYSVLCSLPNGSGEFIALSYDFQWNSRSSNKVPKIPVQILEHSNGAICLGFRFPDECNPGRNHIVVISPEIIGVEKQKDSATGLVANEWLLFSL